MKKSKIIKLIIVGTSLSACSNKEGDMPKNKMYLRTDTSASYSRPYYHGGGYYHFRSFGLFQNGRYSRIGMESNNISKKSSLYARTVSRSGFGKTGRGNHYVGG
ncbi:hypothetical protein QQ054_07600 [Oscillatoria amoena NRMC-F 0135]|nr:hypothetical protein [Oscillatoria amoena NRMC-F 0135]